MNLFRRPHALSKHILAAGVFGLFAAVSPAATLMNMTFDDGVANEIDEMTGWDGTTAPGGSLATGLIVTAGLKINGDFLPGTGADDFHVDNWQSPNTNAAATYVSVVLGAQSGYTFDLTGPGASFSTLVHQHPKSGGDVTKIFDQVELVIGSTSFGYQPYTAGGSPQTLSWDLSSSGLAGLSSATFKMYFTSTQGVAADPGSQTNHGPEWGLNDGAFVRVSGTVNVVPEPSRAVLALAGLGLALVRRRRA